MLGEFRNDLKEIVHYPVGSYAEDRRVGIFVDSDNNIRRLHANKVLYLTTNAASDV